MRTVSTRSTAQRAALIDALSRERTFRSAQELHASLRLGGTRVALATVYRNLARLVETGTVDVLHREDGEATYHLGSPRHHHHLVCRACGACREFADPALEQWIGSVAAEHRFTAITHELTVYGLCPACAAREPSP